MDRTRTPADAASTRPAEADPELAPGLRRAPRQARSRARVGAIYAAAEKIIATDGVDGLTMRRLAEEAGVPIGTVYQFFTDKPAVLDAVAARHMATFEPLMVELREAARDRHWREIVDTMFDRMIERTRGGRVYREILVGHHLSPRMRRADDANIDAVAEVLRSTLVRQEHLTDVPELEKACRVAVLTADALLQLAFRIDPDGDPATLREARRIEHLYLDDIATGPRFRPRRPVDPS